MIVVIHDLDGIAIRTSPVCCDASLAASVKITQLRCLVTVLKIFLEGLRRLFLSAGALVDTAESMAGFETILADDGRVPDIIITDIRLRDGPTGIEVAERIRRDFAEPLLLLRKSSAPESTLAEVSRFVAAQQRKGFDQAPDP